MALPNLQSYSFILQAGVSTPAFTRYVENSNNQAAVDQKTTINVPASTNFVAVNLATLFPALTAGQVLVVKEITQTGTGFNISPVNTNVGFLIRPSSVFAAGISALSTFYVSNPTATPIQLEVTIVGS